MSTRAFLLSICLLVPPLGGCLLGQAQPDQIHGPAWILRATPPELYVQILYVEGREPSPLALGEMERVLREVTAKSTITIGEPELVPPMGLFDNRPNAWSDLRARYKEVDETQTARIIVVYPEGCPRDESEACAVAGHGSPGHPYPTALVYKDAIWGLHLWRNVTRLTEPAGVHHQIERTVLIHEIGHVLGLVDNGIPMVRPHADPEDPQHSSNPRSVMHTSWEAVDFIPTHMEADGVFPYRFDEDDLADLKAYRERKD